MSFWERAGGRLSGLSRLPFRRTVDFTALHTDRVFGQAGKFIFKEGKCLNIAMVN